MSLRVGGLTHVICDCCGRRYRVRSIIPDEDVGLWLELKCFNRSCGQVTAMAISSYRAYGSYDRGMDKVMSCRR